MQNVKLIMYFLVSCLSLLVWLVSNVLIIVLIAQPNSANVTVSSDVTLTCEPQRGTPEEYSWHRVDGDIPLHSSGQNSSRLTIHRIVPADEGEYYCMGTAFGHCATSNTIEVMVNGKKGYHKSYSSIQFVLLSMYIDTCNHEMPS